MQAGPYTNLVTVKSALSETTSVHWVWYKVVAVVTTEANLLTFNAHSLHTEDG